MSLSPIARGLPALPAPGGGQDRIDDSPRREVRLGLVIAAFFFILLLGWAALARLDAAAIGLGRVTVSGQRQTVQHRDGGVVGQIFVREGVKVREGQLLLRLAAAEVQAQERAYASQVIGLLAQRARLRAEQVRAPAITPPEEFASLSGADRAEADRALQVQRLQLRTRSSLLATQQGVLGQQRAQVGEQGQGLRSQLVAIVEQERLIQEELEQLRTVAEKGFVSVNRIRALERTKADLAGQRGRLQAAISESSESIGETRLRVVETEATQQQQIASELRDVEFSLGDLMPKWRAAKDQLARTEVRAPVTGTVVGLSIFTEGGVVSPGQKLMDIVPERMPLVIEARFAPTEVDDLRLGQRADVRFTGIPDQRLPPLAGEVRRISADAFSDEKTGESYFTAEIVVPTDQLDQVERNTRTVLRPGMPAEVVATTRRRTALQYLLEPLTNSLWRSFRED